MKVLLTVQPAWSHLNTVVPHAQALRAAGHEVLVVAPPTAAARLRGLSVPSLAAGKDWVAEDSANVLPGFERASAASQARALLRLAPQLLSDSEEAVRDWAPDLVLRDAYDLGGALLAGRLGAPLAVLGIGFRAASSWRTGVVGPTVRRAYRQAGLGHLDPDAHATGARWFSAYPPLLSDPSDPLPGERFVYLPPGDLGRAAAPRAPGFVYVTLGTVYSSRTQLLRRMIGAARRTGHRVVVTAGAALAEVADEADDRVDVVGYAPQSQLLTGAAAVLSHGGFNTVMPALAARVPVCMLPVGSDHHLSAVRLAEAVTVVSTGTTVQGLPVAVPEDVAEDQLVLGLAAALEGPAPAARAVADAFEALPGESAVVRELEALAEREGVA